VRGARVTKERLYFKERKRGRVPAIMKEGTGQLKSIKKQRRQKKGQNSLKFHPWIPQGKQKPKMKSQGKPDLPGARLTMLAVG
jgi:hypothetical protein